MSKFRMPKTFSSNERRVLKIKEDLDKRNSSIEEEFKLIIEKKSNFSKSERDLIILMVGLNEEFKQIKGKG